MIGPILRAKEDDALPTPELTNASNHHTHQLVQQWLSGMGYYIGTLSSQMGQVSPSNDCPHTTTSTGVKGDTWRQTKWSLRMLHKTREQFYWPGMSRSVGDWCRTCPSCAAHKRPSQKRHGPPQNLKAGYHDCHGYCRTISN